MSCTLYIFIINQKYYHIGICTPKNLKETNCYNIFEREDISKLIYIFLELSKTNFSYEVSFISCYYH